MNKEDVFRFKINLTLLEIFKNFKGTETEYLKLSLIVKNEGLIKDQDIKSYLYTHKQMAFLSDYLQKFNCEKIEKNIFNDIVKQNMYSLCNSGNEYGLDYDFVLKNYEINKSLFKSENLDIFINIINSLDQTISHNNTGILINSNFVKYGLKTNGRLDIFFKAHLLKQIFLYFDNETDFHSSLNNMESDILKTITFGEFLKLTEEKYMEYVEIFVNKKDKIDQSLREIKKSFSVLQNLNDSSSLKILEKLFIQLLGHYDTDIRNEAVILLNMLYDETTWQEKSPFTILKIRNVGEVMKLDLLIRKKDYLENQIVCILNTPCISNRIKNSIVTWNSITKITECNENANLLIISFEFAPFAKCGYYDWNVVKFKDGRFSGIKFAEDIKMEDSLKEAKGRFIVVDKTLKDLSVHEVFCDLLGSEIDKEKGKISKRGTFKTLEDQLEDYNQRYVNCIYIMGALERDNCIVTEEDGSVLDIGNLEASPMAVTCRATVSKLLGGDKAFNSLIQKAKKFSMKIFVDSLTRISSSRAHKKYKNILVNYLDESGKKMTCYGTDGHSVNYEDSAVLNYRKIETWDLMVNDVISLASKHKIDGIHLDNCQNWPQMFEIDHDEMFRNDTDGTPAYTALEILNGDIVLRNEESGYWNSDLIDQYSNPFLVKLTKAVWNQFPHFNFVAECWSNQKFLNRHVVLTRSGVIPRMYTLPRVLSAVFGRRIHRNGYIELSKPSPVSIFKEWFDENNQCLPDGAVVIQSSSGQVWPYPALLYGRGNWSAVDLLFTLPDVPMTFMEEINGEAYRVQITNVYQVKDIPKNIVHRSLSMRSKSFMKLMEYDPCQDIDSDAMVSNLSKLQLQENISRINSISTTNSSNVGLRRSINSSSQIKTDMPKIKSVVSLSGISTTDLKTLKEKQDIVIKEVGPEFGFDLNKIKFHYDHRRKMRNIHESLRHGAMIYLNAFDINNDPHYNVFAFARFCPEETGIIAINFANITVKNISYLPF